MKLWKDNRIAGQWELTTDEIAERFLKTESAMKMLDGWPLRRALLAFICGHEYLNSSFGGTTKHDQRETEKDLRAIEAKILEGWRKREKVAAL